VSRNTDFQDVVRNIAYTAHNQYVVKPSTNGDGRTDLNIEQFLTTPMNLIATSDSTATATGASGDTVNDVLINTISVIRENILIKRISHFNTVDTDKMHQFGLYVHGKVGGDGSVSGTSDTIQMGTQASIIAINTQNPIDHDTGISEEVRGTLATTAKKLAMHIVAANPLYLHKDNAPQDVIDREMKIFK